MKETYYFSHDYNARSDIKIRKLIAKHGYIGYGIFWGIIEDLYNNANEMPLDYFCLSNEYKTNEDVINSIINDFGLFEVDNNIFGSLSVQKRLDTRKEKSIKARISAYKRWGICEGNANALQTECAPNAIKERKGKENKGKENVRKSTVIDIDNKKNNKDIRELEFTQKVKTEFKGLYSETMLDEFCNYWTESNPNGKKMKFEMQQTFDIKKRLSKWAGNNFKKEYKHPITTHTNNKLYEQF